MKLPFSRGEGAGASDAEGDAPAAVDDAFHRLYAAARTACERAVPIMLVSTESVTICRGDEVRELRLEPRDFASLKSTAHAPVAIYAGLYRGAGGSLAPEARQAMDRLGHLMRASLESLGGREDEVASDLRDLLGRSTAFVDDVLARGLAERASLERFARESGEGLGRLTAHATRAQLEALDAAVDDAVAMLARDERAALQVVVAGDHQARRRSLAMQYFEKRFREAPNAETRLAYGEGVTSLEEARALVGTRQLDRAVASAFFADPKRLQQDVLGDAAATLLAERKVGPIA